MLYIYEVMKQDTVQKCWKHFTVKEMLGKKKKHWKTLERFSILSPSEKDKTLEGLRI